MNDRSRELDRHLGDIATKRWAMSIGSQSKVGGGEVADVVNPTSGDKLARLAAASEADVAEAVTAAEHAAPSWGATAPMERARYLRDLATILDEHAEELAWLDTLNAGLPLWMMRIDVATGVQRMRMFSDFAFALGGQTIPASVRDLHLTFQRPFGVVARIIPFNHPFMFAASKLAAPLMAGNSVVLKPSELTPLSALRLGELAQEVLPDGVLSVVHGGPAVGEQLVRSESIRRIAFTGSHEVGRKIQKMGAEVGIKHVSLELGGKNAMIVYEDADVDAAVASAVKGMNFAFAGQSCGSTSRVLLHHAIAERFTSAFVRAVDEIKMGLPWESGTQIGPMVSPQQQSRVAGFINRALDSGAVRLTASRPAVKSGNFAEPVVFANVDPGSELAQEEVFGPVVSLFRFEDDAESIRLANDVRYGLTASIWTKNVSRAFAAAQALDAGYIWINDSATHFPGVPFGGTKLSGIGREESVGELLSYTETTAINVVVSQ